MTKGFAYNGRGMMGQECFGIIGLENLLTAIRESNMPTDGWQSDSLGKDTVYYNRHVPAPDENELELEFVSATYQVPLSEDNMYAAMKREGEDRSLLSFLEDEGASRPMYMYEPRGIQFVLGPDVDNEAVKSSILNTIRKYIKIARSIE